MSRRILSIDPGFAWLGWSVVAAGETIDTVIAMGLARTDKDNRKGGVKQADDNFRRAQELGQSLLNAVDEYKPFAICFEAFKHVRSSSTAAKVGHAYGAVAMLTVFTGLPVVCVSPQEVRRTLGLRQGSTKDDVEVVVRTKLISAKSKVAMQTFEDTYKRNKANHNHAWDSLGIYLACRDSEVIRTLRLL